MKRRPHALLIFAALAAGCFVSFAPAQQQRRNVPPILTRVSYQAQDWRVTMELVLEGSSTWLNNVQAAISEQMELERAVVVMPVAPVTASAAPRTSGVKGSMRGDKGVIDDSVRMLSGYQAGDRLAALDIKDPINTNVLRINLEVPMRCWETKIDERRALELMWPGEKVDELYPEEALSALQPSRFIESDAQEIRDLVFNWTGGDPRILRPYALAKHLAAKVIDHYMPTDERFATINDDHDAQKFRTVLPIAGTYFGLRVDGALAAATADKQRGPVFDLPNLLCAVYRAAGIPARIVIGYDPRSEQSPQQYPAITAWVEFYLWDTANARGEWIPVDIIRQRQFASKAPPITQPWKYFGTIEDAEFFCPLSLHWHPPTFVMSEGPPLLWGWLPTPSDQHAIQRLRFYATDPGKRADDEPFDGTEEGQ